MSEKKFENWSYHNIQIWLGFSLIPEIIKRNYKNLKGINDCLENFHIKLTEFHIF